MPGDVQALETVETQDDVVGCEGSGGPMGHPRVYLNLGAQGEIECPYCGRRYVKKAGSKRGGGH